jgi:SPP1 gp7 family putative phage head morphogenesis protein
MVELWKPKQRIEKAYQRSITNLLNSVWDNVRNITDPLEIEQTIRNIVSSKVFKSYAESAAMKMVTGLFTDNGRTWRQASKANMQGKLIHEMLKKQLAGRVGAGVQQQIDRNARLIITLPIDVAQQVTNHIKERSLAGKRANTIAEEIQQMFPGSSKARAALIARTEVSKTSTALTRARSENIGIRWYVWKTSDDGRVRSSHKHMSDVLIPWSSPPSPERLEGLRSVGHYHAGEIWNCRCYAEPLIEVEYLSWPHKVYYGGRIVTMGKKQFEAVM